MFRVSLFALLGGCLVLSGDLSGQVAKKDEPKTEKGTKEGPKETGKAKGVLPQNWAKIGLTEDQKQAVYRIQMKYATDLDKLTEKVKEVKGARDQEMKAVLSADQKKKLEEILTTKSK